MPNPAQVQELLPHGLCETLFKSAGPDNRHLCSRDSPAMSTETILEQIPTLLIHAGAGQHSLTRKSPCWNRFILKECCPWRTHTREGELREKEESKRSYQGADDNCPLSIPSSCWVGEGTRVVSEE